MMSYPIFIPFYPFMDLNTQPHPSKYFPKHVVFPILKIGTGVVPTCPKSPAESQGEGRGHKV